ncbi:GNAT family N-acetyltransferase [Massilia sp. W12]|uniref:GNAT family N-acetyltransferase n=1 Tax=Massilia sp. W12 TaxID=3126507 RepID=UPI0030D27279
MSAKFSVRLAQEADLPAIAPLFDAYRQFYRQSPDVAGAQAFLQQRMQLAQSQILLAQAEDGRLAGFTQLYPVFSSVSMRPAWILNDLYVHPEFRQQGVASALLQAAIAHGRSSGAAWISLQTAHDNAAAQALYRQHGFTQEEKYLSFNYAL